VRRENTRGVMAEMSPVLVKVSQADDHAYASTTLRPHTLTSAAAASEAEEESSRRRAVKMID
jgi:hypothetical protein